MRGSALPYHGTHSRLRYVPAVFLFVDILNGAVVTGFVPPYQSAALTTAHAAHSLSPAEARRAYPVHLRAVVTYYDPYIDPRHTALFVHDATGAIFVLLSSPLPFPVSTGMLVDVAGVTASGDFAPIIDKASVRVIGAFHLPRTAPRVSLTQLLTGTYDGQWVEVEGIVHSVQKFGSNANLDIAVADGSLIATTLTEQGKDYSRLVDAKVRIHANAAPVFNRNLQMTGVRLFFPDLGEVSIEEPAVAEPYALPLLPIDGLLRYTANIAVRHREHVRGRVSLQWPGRSLCIQDTGHGLCVQTSQTTSLAPGELADIAGFPAVGGLTPTLTHAVFRSAGRAQPVPATSVTAEQALHGEQDARLVRIEGKLIGNDRAAQDPTMVLSAGKFLFQVVLPERSAIRANPAWEEGSTLQITGICSVQLAAPEAIREGFSIPASFRILLRSAADVVVLQRPSWWSAAHLLPVLAVVLAVTLGVLGWVVVLRHRIARQTAVIREQSATFRRLSLQDGLTGIANRRRFDESLETEFAKASRTMTPVSLLIVDIDHFKSLNDRYGHQHGDECLVRVAHALASASLTATTDLLARYGGEEFGVILPGCDEPGAVTRAERMRVAVLDLSIANAASPFDECLSISIGAATMVPVSGTPTASLIQMADRALYQSKQQGRNRTTSIRAECGACGPPYTESPLRAIALNKTQHPAVGYSLGHER
jgi:diguanylate cyclase (GGDEF)-like protein